MSEPDLDDIERRMSGAVEALRREFQGLRTGRASAALLDPVLVEVYGAKTPLNQVGTVGVPEPRMLSVQVWDKSNTSAVEKSIRDAGLGLNPMTDGNLIRIPIPELSGERRQELTKVAGRYAEQARVAIRNIRRDAMDGLKKSEKDGEISQDDQKLYSDEIQSLTNKYVGEVDETAKQKEAEILQV